MKYAKDNTTGIGYVPTDVLGDGVLSMQPVSTGGILLQTDTVSNPTQSVLNLISGTNINLTPDAFGGVLIDATSSGPSLQTNGIPNGSQSLLNLVGGINITLTDNGVGGVTIDTNSGVSSLNSLTGAVNIVAGTGITVTPGIGTITIDASGAGSITAGQVGYGSGTNTLTSDGNFLWDAAGFVLSVGDVLSVANSTRFLLDDTNQIIVNTVDGTWKVGDSAGKSSILVDTSTFDVQIGDPQNGQNNFYARINDVSEQFSIRSGTDYVANLTTTPSFKVSYGYKALNTASGDYSTAFGYAAGINVSSGVGNVFLGANTGGSITSGEGNIFIGTSASSNANYSNSIVLGMNASAIGSKQFVMGSLGHEITEMWLGQGVQSGSTPLALLISATRTSGTDIQGSDLSISAGQSTGSAAGGWLYLKASKAGTSGGTANTVQKYARFGNGIAEIGAINHGSLTLLTVGDNSPAVTATSNGNLGLSIDFSSSRYRIGNISGGSRHIDIWDSAGLVSVLGGGIFLNDGGHCDTMITASALVNYGTTFTMATTAHDVQIGRSGGTGATVGKLPNSGLTNGLLGTTLIFSDYGGQGVFGSGNTITIDAQSGNTILSPTSPTGAQTYAFTENGESIVIKCVVASGTTTGNVWKIESRATRSVSSYGINSNYVAYGNSSGGLQGDQDMQFDGSHLYLGKSLVFTSYAGNSVDGAIWNDSSQHAIQANVSGIDQTLVGVAFTQTGDQTVANTTTPTTMLNGGVGTLTLPANFFRVGKSIRIDVQGHHSSTANPNITIEIKLGSTVIATGTGASGNGSTDGFTVSAQLTCRTIGVTGTVAASGFYDEWHTNGLKMGLVQTGTTTIDTTASQVLDVVVTWGAASASNTITSQIASIEVLN